MLKKRIDLDIIRTLAILFVICVHSLSYMGFYQMKEPNIYIYILHFLRVIFISCVPLFLLLTGYLYGLKDISFSFKRSKKLISLLTIYLIMGLLCSIPLLYKNDFKGYIISIFTFTACPYGWYIAMYCGLFLLMPILNSTYKVIKSYNNNALLYFVIILVLLIVFPTLFNNFNFNNTNWWYADQDNCIEIIPNYWFQLYPLLYYFIGTIIHDFDFKIKNFNKKIVFICLLLFIILFSLINYFTNINQEFAWNYATSYGGYQCFIISILIFLLIINTKLSTKFITKPISVISKYSFGIYLISYVFDVLWYKLLDRFNLSISSKLLIMPFSVLTILSCSLIISIVVTKLTNRVIKI